MKFRMKTSILALLWILGCVHTLPASARSIELVSQNLNRLFDDKDDGNHETVLSSKQYHRRLNRLVKRITTGWALPDVMAFQEVENRHILTQLATRVLAESGVSYQSMLIEGNDPSGIDVGFLIRKPIQLKRVEALFSATGWPGHHHPLFSRPPLRIDICLPGCVTIVNVHLRSMRGINSSKRASFVRNKRHHQAQTLARWIDQFQRKYPARPLMIIGDFNALTPSDPYVDVIGTVLGQPDQQRPLLKSVDLIDADLIDATRQLPASQRYSYRYRKKHQQLDYLLISQSLKKHLQHIAFGKIDYRLSDHAALMARIKIVP